tara:strand:- start:508 stop:1092 length:585 start_codon:yes stop_codon:yes gene_type:complete
MAKLYFNYSTMNAGKTTVLLQAAHNYLERGMNPFLLTANADTRSGIGTIKSRIGLKKSAQTFSQSVDLLNKVKEVNSKKSISCVFVDEAQFLTEEQVWQLAKVVDDIEIPVLCFGLRVDFQGNLFPGSKCLLSIADELKEVKTICHCGKKATMVIRQLNGKTVIDGDQVQIGGNESYTSLCRKHWLKEFEKAKE